MATLTRSITYAELVTAINTSTLHKGESITITDFATTHYLCNANGVILDTVTSNPIINTGTVERLVVTATSVNTLDPQVLSLDFPNDIISWDWNPVNWIQDIGFSIDQINIIPDFKGVIYRREDTYQHNILGYDFRTVKFRRWKKNYPVWDDITTFIKGDIVQVTANGCYISLIDNNLNNLVSDTASWMKIIDYINSEYWEIDSTVALDVTDYQDYLTFVENVSGLYVNSVWNNIFVTTKDNQIQFNGTIGSILNNNVFFLANNGNIHIMNNNLGIFFESNTIDYGFWSNTIESSFNTNIIGANCSFNKIGDYFESNTIGYSFNSNTIGTSFNTNIIGDSFRDNGIGHLFNTNTIGFFSVENTIGNSFADNIIGVHFQGNGIGNNFESNIIGNEVFLNAIGNSATENIIGNSFQKNTIGIFFAGNSIGESFQGNCIGNNFASNIIGERLQNNTIGNVFSTNTIGNDFFFNAIGNNFASNIIGSGFFYNTIEMAFTFSVVADVFHLNTSHCVIEEIDFTLSTHVYAEYTCELFKRSDGVVRLRYTDANDILQVVDPTTSQTTSPFNVIDYVTFIDGFRAGTRSGVYVIDKELTVLGFDGVENTDWENIYSAI
jgi:hypothetical protein